MPDNAIFYRVAYAAAMLVYGGYVIRCTSEVDGAGSGASSIAARVARSGER
jgi:hypothetical protein